jgi:hypothetical protein
MGYHLLQQHIHTRHCAKFLGYRDEHNMVLLWQLLENTNIIHLQYNIIIINMCWHEKGIRETVILLISASWVARIIGVSHQYPAKIFDLIFIYGVSQVANLLFCTWISTCLSTTCGKTLFSPYWILLASLLKISWS